MSDCQGLIVQYAQLYFFDLKVEQVVASAMYMYVHTHFGLYSDHAYMILGFYLMFVAVYDDKYMVMVHRLLQNYTH